MFAFRESSLIFTYVHCDLSAKNKQRGCRALGAPCWRPVWTTFVCRATVMAEPQLDERPVSTPSLGAGLKAASFVRRSVSRSRGSLLTQSQQNLLARQVDPNAVLNSLTNGGSIPAEEINEAITVAAKTSTKTFMELIALADPSMLSEAVRRGTRCSPLFKGRRRR